MKEKQTLLAYHHHHHHHHLFFLLLFCNSISPSSQSPVPSPLLTTTSNSTDAAALLSFKSLLSDPQGALSSWISGAGSGELPLCQWQNVTCGRRHGDRVVALYLADLGLAGPISPQISNLTFLTFLYLSDNNLAGPIPPEIFLLPRLRDLRLDGNLLSGEIPATLSRCSSLRKFGVTGNFLSGELPADIGDLTGVQFLNLGANDFAGEIPASIGNMSSLIALFLLENDMGGPLPESFGKLRSLKILQIRKNSFSGEIPPSFFNLSSLRLVYVSYNSFSGELPAAMFDGLPAILSLVLNSNSLRGPIPSSLSNASSLVELDLEGNMFSGEVPARVGDLPYLLWLNLGENRVAAAEEKDWDFMSSLSNCTQLQELNLENNAMGGPLPSSIARLPTSLNFLVMGSNRISGSLPEDIGNLYNLTIFYLNDNLLAGEIPSSIGKLQSLHEFNLEGNRFAGEIPSSMGELVSINKLSLRGNELDGAIPASFGKLRQLEELDLSANRLSGDIPPELAGLALLSIKLNLSNNQLGGAIPPEVSGLKNLAALDVSNNVLSGEIPASLGECQSLEFLDLSGNAFYGDIPEALANLKGLQELDLSHNNLTGKIPTFLEGLRALNLLDLSFNDLEGEVPGNGVFRNKTEVSIMGNQKLCSGGRRWSLPTCDGGAKKKKNSTILVSVIGGVILLLILLAGIWVPRWLVKMKKKGGSSSSSMEDPFMKISYSELAKATEGFSTSNLIGEGGVGSVYKGILPNGDAIAVKVMDLRVRGASESFMAECEAFRHIRHRNLVKIISVCSSIDFHGGEFKAIVFEHMANGSLDEWLHRRDHRKPPLLLFQRLEIGLSVASAVDYLHNHGHTPIVHCDLKPSNVLLDDDMVAHVGDFGIARILSDDQQEDPEGGLSSAVAAAQGTIGYLAPEYGMGCPPSTQGDVYAYGILLLEMLTGKSPIDGIFNEELTLHDYVERAAASSLHGGEAMLSILDPCLLVELDDGGDNDEDRTTAREEMQKCLASAIRVGLSCVIGDPRERMEMKGVVKDLGSICDVVRRCCC